MFKVGDKVSIRDDEQKNIFEILGVQGGLWRGTLEVKLRLHSKNGVLSNDPPIAYWYPVDYFVLAKPKKTLALPDWW